MCYPSAMHIAKHYKLCIPSEMAGFFVCKSVCSRLWYCVGCGCASVCVCVGCVCMAVCTYVCVRVCVCVPRVHVCARVCTCVMTYAHMCVRIHAYTCVYVRDMVRDPPPPGGAAGLRTPRRISQGQTRKPKQGNKSYRYTSAARRRFFDAVASLKRHP